MAIMGKKVSHRRRAAERKNGADASLAAIAAVMPARIAVF
jgi:hypothetical protein